VELAACLRCAVAKLLQRRFRLHQRVAHARYDCPPFLGRRRAIHQVFQRLAKAVEHQWPSSWRPPRECVGYRSIPQPRNAHRPYVDNSDSHRPPTILVTSTTEKIRGRSRVRVNEAYTDALAAAGVIPLIVPPLHPGLAEQATGGVGGIVLTGGEDVDPASYGAAPHPATGVPHEARDAYEIALTRVARDRGIPLLAICRGAQVVNVAF